MAGADVTLNSKNKRLSAIVFAGVQFQRLHGGGVLVIEIGVVNEMVQILCRSRAEGQGLRKKRIRIGRAATQVHLDRRPVD